MRIGIFIRDIHTLLNWELRIIEHIKNNPNYELVVLLKDGRQGQTNKTSLFKKFSKFLKKKNLIGKFLFYTQVKIESFFFYKRPASVDWIQILDYLKNIPEEKLYPNRKGFLDIFNDEDADKTKAYNLDLLLRYEFNIIRGEILNTAKYGIWSFHHGDNAINRGGPAGFWEIALKQPAVGVTLQQLTSELDGGLVIDKAYYSKHWSYTKTNIMLTENSVNLLLKNLRLLHEGEYNPTKSLVYYNELYVAPRIITAIKYILHFYSSLINKITDRLLMRLGKRSYCWTLFVGKGNFMNATLFRIKPAVLPKDEFWADPFLYKHKDETYIFFENYSYTTKLGKISCGKLENKTITKVVDVLELDYHLSFPYVFENEGELFMMPETSENKRLEIFKCLEFPNKWELQKTAFEGEVVVDAFFHTDELKQMWLFLNKQTAPDSEADSELYIYRVDSPELNSIEPHKQNPVLIDARVGRNGGCTFVHNNKTYRPSQSNTHGIYGRALNINEIETLTINEYKENLITTIEPNFRKGIERIHHLHQIDDMYVFDAAFKRK
jgi:hypothetical protein